MNVILKKNLNLSDEPQNNSLLNDEDYHINRYSIPKGLQVPMNKEKRVRRIFKNKCSQDIEAPIMNTGNIFFT